MGKNGGNIGNGGDAGEIFIAARKIVGNGSIMAIGGDGAVGGKGGKITLITDNNQFAGQISTKGGKSLDLDSDNNGWYKKWWMLYIIYPFGVLIIGTAVLKLIKII